MYPGLCECYVIENLDLVTVFQTVYFIVVTFLVGPTWLDQLQTLFPRLWVAALTSVESFILSWSPSSLLGVFMVQGSAKGLDMAYALKLGLPLSGFLLSEMSPTLFSG